MAVDPDSRARTHLANERTFLAWFRTGITLIALGLAAAQFLGAGLLAILGVVAGAVMVIVGLVRYRSSVQHIDDGDFQPANMSIIVTGVLGILIAIVAIVLLRALGPFR